MRRTQTATFVAAFILVFLGYACSSEKTSQDSETRKPAPDTAAADVAAREEPEPEAPAPEGSDDVGVPFEMTDEPAKGSDEPDVVPPVQPGEESPAPEPVTQKPPAETAPETEPGAETADTALRVSVPPGPVRVAPTKDGLTYVGPEKCNVCHKVQYASWMEMKHASLTPALDCESCHGPGSAYRPLKIMKDPAAAREAGLVIPTATFCKTCHVGGWDDTMLKKAHAHKEVPE
jgi:hypothetical protein